MVFPEGRQDSKAKDGDGKGGTSEKYIGVEENRRFDTVDRKDMYRSPDPRTFIPGFERWYDQEVDKYYDGWLDHHIENAGGKVVGSNTEKMMNLNDGERNHAPVYPTEASYEKLLESRHNFDDDYNRKVAFNLKKIKKAGYDLDELRDESKEPRVDSDAVPADHTYKGKLGDFKYTDPRVIQLGDIYDLKKVYNTLRNDRYYSEKHDIKKIINKPFESIQNDMWKDLLTMYPAAFEPFKRKDVFDFTPNFGETPDEQIGAFNAISRHLNLNLNKTSKKKI
jgi:hypothetical protein